MKTVFHSSDRQELLERFARLTPDRMPVWGKMSCTQMLTHCVDPLRAAMGEMRVASKGRALLRFPPLRYAIIHWLPIPKGAPTAPEFIPPVGGDWKKAQASLAEVIGRFAGAGAKGGPFVAHPAFGELTAHQWGLLTWKHLDHHLRQFGG